MKVPTVHKLNSNCFWFLKYCKTLIFKLNIKIRGLFPVFQALAKLQNKVVEKLFAKHFACRKIVKICSSVQAYTF